MLRGNILLCGKGKMSRMRGKTYSNFEMGFNKTESENTVIHVFLSAL